MSSTKRTLHGFDPAGRRAFVRVDFNVPLVEGEIGDDTRIQAALPTLHAILDGGGSAVVATHLGRPKGQVVEELRVAPVARALAAMLPGVKVEYVPEVTGEAASSAAAALEPGQILVLENLRFDPRETANDPRLAEELAGLADYFVQDAFGTCHRAHASTAGVPALLKPALAGLLLEREIEAFEMVFRRPARPLVAVVGGAKVGDKIPVLENLLEKVDAVLVGGGMAYTFLKAQSIAIGNSLFEARSLEKAKDILNAAEEKDLVFKLPSDHVVADRFAADAEHKLSSPHVPDGWMGMDIGPETRKAYAEVIAEAGTVVWNGPMGVFEMEAFRAGTAAVARAVAESGCHSVVGGGDVVAAIQLEGLGEAFTHISTGGGAFLEMLEGKELPGIAALDEKSSVPA